MIGETISHYRVLERIGGGGMGVVYKAEDLGLGRVVALKFLNPAFTSNETNRKRFLREAQAASLIDHPNVCHVYEVEEANDRLFIAMAYYGGRSLRSAIDIAPFTPRQAFEITFSVAQGLWAAHRRGIVHRDIKPANIVMSEDGFVKIVDFGLAQLAGHSRVTTGDTLVGTVAYMSPEQTNASHVDERTDIWSLGVVMYEAMTGRLPFPDNANAAVLYSIRNEPHPPLRDVNPEVPEACATVVERCLQKKPDDRYPTVEAMLTDMVAAAKECGWSDTVGSRTIAPILSAKRRRAWVRRLAVAAAVLAVAAGAWWLWEHRPAPSPFTTDQRIAVVPFRNLLGPAYGDFVVGLADHSARALDAIQTDAGALWTVPYANIAHADLPDPFDAGPSFGVNRIVMGEVQRFGDGQQLTLELRDADSHDLLRTERVRVDRAAAGALLPNLDTALARLVGARDDAVPRSLETENGSASIRYLIGAGRNVFKGDSAALEHTVALLDSCVNDDSKFVAGAWASGVAHMALYRHNKSDVSLQRAAERARTIAALDNSFALGAVLSGDAWQAGGDVDSAASAYRSALALDPGNHSATRSLASIYAAQSRLEEAEGVYRALANVKPDYWASHRELGYFYFLQDRLDDAETEWSHALRLAPRDAWTQSSLGAVYYRRDDWTRARACFVEAFQIQPACDPCNNIATTLYFDGKYKESAHYFELALQYCDTSDCDTWGNLASALYWVEDGRERSRVVYGKAIRNAEAALAAQPGDARLTALLIDYYSMSDDSAMTQATIARAGDLANTDAHVMYSVGSAYEKMGQRGLALRYLGNAVRHGYSLQIIRGAPLLADLLKDPIFQDMTHRSDSADAATVVNRN